MTLISSFAVFTDHKQLALLLQQCRPLLFTHLPHLVMPSNDNSIQFHQQTIEEHNINTGGGISCYIGVLLSQWCSFLGRYNNNGLRGEKKQIN